jgi:hypothetical protein
VPYVCPACQQSFDEAGFCPHDGTRLADAHAIATPTLLSTATAAEPAPTHVERRGTLPLSRTPPAPAPPEIRALSAS